MPSFFRSLAVLATASAAAHDARSSAGGGGVSFGYSGNGRGAFDVGADGRGGAKLTFGGRSGEGSEIGGGFSSSSSSGGGSGIGGSGIVGSGSWRAPGGSGAQHGVTVDFRTFFELFAHGGADAPPVHTLEDCLVAWREKFLAVSGGPGGSDTPSSPLSSSSSSSSSSSGGGGTETASVLLEHAEHAPSSLHGGFDGKDLPPQRRLSLPGEVVVALVRGRQMVEAIGGARYSLGEPGAMPPLSGTLRLTNYRLLLSAGRSSAVGHYAMRGVSA